MKQGIIQGQAAINFVVDDEGNSVVSQTCLVLSEDAERGILVADLNDKECRWYVNPDCLLVPSHNSVLVFRGCEYFLREGSIYKSKLSNPMEGNQRSGSRFECTQAAFPQLLTLLGVRK